MKLEIELKEFWLDEESDLEPALKNHVIHEAVMQVKASIKDRIETKINEEVKRQVEETMYKLINDTVAEIISTESIKERNSGKEMSIVDYVKNKFTNGSNYVNADDSIKKLATNFGNEMKNRYDLLFASQLVAKMSDNGLLREDVAKLLLPQPNQS